MKNSPASNPPIPTSHSDRSADKISVIVVRERPAGDLPVEQVDHGRQVRRSFPRVDLGDVTNEPHPRPRRSEITPDQIHRARPGALLSFVPPRLRMARHQALVSHNRRDELVATQVTFPAELGVDTPVPVRAVRRVEHPPHLHAELRPGLRRTSRSGTTPRVVTRRRHTRPPAHSHHRKIGLLHRNQRKPFFWFCVAAKKAAAFFRKAFSISKSAIRRCNDFISRSSSLTTTPCVLRPAYFARFTQTRSVSAFTPSSDATLDIGRELSVTARTASARNSSE